MVNIPLLVKTMEHIEAHPEEHEQAVWRSKSACGAAYCFAGHAALIAGADPPSETQGSWDVYPSGRIAPSYSEGSQHVSKYAADQLGLSESVADFLFCGGNSRADLRAMVNWWAEHPEASDAEFKAWVREL